VIIGLLSTLVLAAVVLAVLIVRRLQPIPLPYFVAYWVASYGDRRVPSAPTALADLRAIQEGKYFPRTAPGDDSPLQWSWARLQEEISGRPSSDRLVLYVSAMASCDAGEVRIWPPDVKPENPQTARRLAELLAALKACPAGRKLLVLDIMRPVTDPSLGVVAEDLAARIEAEVAGAKDPRLTVLCACGPGEVALESEALGRTVFNYYFEEALRGRADVDSSDGVRDNVVSVAELFEYVKQRVEQWAALNRNAHQTPRLLGDRGDFPVVDLRKSGRREPRPLRKMANYAEGLRDGWKLRDRWWAEGVHRQAPRLFRQWEAELLAAEHDWRGGAADAIERLSARRKELEGQLERIRSVPGPRPASLGLALALGQTPDEDVTRGLNELLARRGMAIADRKPDLVDLENTKAATEFLQKIKDRPEFALAWAVVQAAMADRPRPDTIRYLDQRLAEARRLRKREPQPQYAETFFLQDLAALAASGSAGDWREDLVERALGVIGQEIEVERRLPGNFPWIRRQLDEAVRHRHTAQVLLRAPGFASPDEAGRAWDHAGRSFQAILSYEADGDGVRRRLDEAMVLLPAYVPYLEAARDIEGLPSNRGTWTAAIERACEGLTLFAPAAGGSAGQPDLTEDELAHRDRQWSQIAQGLGDLLDQLRRPFETKHVGDLIARAKVRDAGVATSLEIEALLRAPLLGAEDRANLWKAGLELAHQLHVQREGESTAVTQDRPVGDPTHVLSQRMWDRVQSTASLLELGGLRSTTLQGLLKPPGDRSDEIALGPEQVAALKKALPEAWTRELPEAFHKETNLAARDRLGRVVPPLDRFDPLDENPLQNPTVRRRAEEARALWAWFADRYRYEERDFDDPTFYASAAREFRTHGGSRSEPYLRIESDTEAIVLSTTRPTADVSLRFTLMTPAGEGQTVEIGTSNPSPDRLIISPTGDERAADAPRSLTLAPAVPQAVSWVARLVPEPKGARTVPARGFLAQARLGERVYHVRVPLVLKGEDEGPRLVLSGDPDRPDAPLGEIRLRPVGARRPYSLHVRNPTDGERNLVVELRSQDAPLPGGEAKLTVAAGKTMKVTGFTDSAPKPPERLPELSGPLEIRLLDASTRDELDRKMIRVSLLAPSEIVQVTDVWFAPPGVAGEKNRLECKVRNLIPISGPPCPVELVLPPGRIPGYTPPPKNASLQGQLRGRDGVQVLFAEDMLLDPAAEGKGVFYLNVDNYERAMIFRTTFAFEGVRQIPREDDLPALRHEAKPYVRTGTTLEVGVEVDNAPPQSRLEVSLGGFEAGGRFVPQRREPPLEPRERHIGFAPGAAGALLFEGAVDDWTISFNTQGIAGRRTIRARLLDANGGEILQPVDRDVYLIDRPPGNIQIVDLPKRLPPKQAAVIVRAVATPTPDGIDSVQFFVGRPDAAGKVPPGVTPIAASAVDPARTEWIANLPLPPNTVGRVDVSVLFANKVGFSGSQTGSTVIDEESAKGEGTKAAAQAPGRITGTVVEGDRPQAGLDVLLKNAAGKQIAATRTAAGGVFAFEKVPPGTYLVSSSKPFSQTGREAKAVVEPGKPVDVTLELLR
jgi:hypothetical protein